MTLELKNVSYAFKDRKPENKILSNLSFTVSNGEFVSLIGRSGTGKTTILKLITGLLKQDSGEVLLNGKAITLGDVGYMPQRDLLLPWRTIIENIMISAEIQKRNGLTKDRAREWLHRIGLLEYENSFPKQLSGGMRQRVSFLRALLTGKELLLLDEPFGALDALTKKEMQAWLLSFWQELNKTVLFITHDLEEACFLSDRILLLHANKEVEEINVNLKRPRNLAMLHEKELITLRQSLEKKIAYEKI
ncbi:ABC transporter ATP-binding protein [Bacillus sp. DTU_2020_1000418_1_SI_GHA_SEK_038]|uniref:ABC transporter ATP-binding protein n=1 Tax=Bacillus sp. DTU_2020_1000418_1_SI_GHA_SEK_038 TaxID=3077585 RepID=UPI0028E530D4|nr:ABC transporter ATP-binding protein [Bacillus sp. DTU_2020_1000418_1_SI_GHA_SEK_038]WNS77485.1 ABC transporter ATP-binding protein [Bacillus sp. DTU_2020_1000418_1_SI_GHA_SEK_038]